IRSQLSASRVAQSRFFRQMSNRRRNVHRSCPQANDRHQKISRIEQGTLAILGSEESQERAAHRPASANLAHLLLPTLGLRYTVANECYEQRRRSAYDEHRAPAEARSDRVVRYSREE